MGNLVPIGHASSNSFSSNSVWAFNRDGTGTTVSRVVSIGDPDPGDSGATSAINTTSDFTYTIGDGGALTIIQGPINSTLVAGPAAGQQTQSVNMPPQTGYVSRDKKTLVFGSYDPGVETVSRVDLVPPVVTSQRICHRTNTAIRIDADR